MRNRIEAGQSYWFRSSWDKKHDRESFIGNDNECKIIISDRILDFEGKYKIAEVKKLADNYSIVSLGDREKPEDLFSGIGLDDAIDVLKKFGFEIFVRDYDYLVENDILGYYGDEDIFYDCYGDEKKYPVQRLMLDSIRKSKALEDYSALSVFQNILALDEK